MSAKTASNGSHAPTIVVNTPIRDLSVYRQLASMVRRLKRHGHVEMNISALAEKSTHEIPDGGSPWHEYASFNPTPAKFFPDALLAPFLPESFVMNNRRLLLEKARILDELGLGAAFWSYEPNFLPEAFFEAYPRLRGPRTDHPRRSRKDEFAPCVDAPESREMTTRMVQTLTQHVPTLGTYFFKTNDAGPGLCWSHWQYAGANGPGACRNRTTGQRVRGLVESIQEGARREGRELTVHFTGNFSAGEISSIESELPDNAFMRGGGESVSIGSCADLCYPARGILDLVGTLSQLQRLRGRDVRTIFLDLRTFYDRSYETLEVSDRLLEVVDDFLAAPAYGPIAMYQRARDICDRWVGETHGATLFEAMCELHEAIKYKRAALPRMNTIYGAVSLRYISRPLLVVPERLGVEEEAYFLPYVFNVSHERARSDYIDVHGTRQTPEWMTLDDADPRIWAVDAVRSRFEAVARRLRSLADPCWQRMAGAVRLYGSLLRSSANFFAVQLIRDRHAQRLNRAPSLPSARAVDSSHPDLAMLNEIIRDELDNSAELVQLLRTHGLEIISHADAADEEDTFLLGPDIVAQVERKMRLMRAHWCDAESFFTTPNK